MVMVLNSFHIDRVRKNDKSHERSSVLQIILIGFLLSSFSNIYSVFGEVIEHPKSTDSVIGDDVTLTCKISLNKCCARWKHNPSGEKDALHSITSNLEVTVRYKDRFSLNANTTTGFYNLTIRNIRKDDAGKYLCSDGDVKDEKYFAELVVMDTPPVCEWNVSVSEVVSDNDCGMPVDSIQLSCSVGYFGNIPPQLRWKHIVSTSDSSTSKVKSTAVAKVEWNKDGFVNYECGTASLRSTRSCYTPAIRLMYTFNTTVRKSIHCPQTTTCSVNTSQDCQYKWFLGGKQISELRDYQFTKDSAVGTYRCEAECNIRGTSCIVHPLVVDYQPLESTSIGTIIWIVILVNAILIIAAAIFVKYRHKIWICFFSRKRRFRHYSYHRGEAVLAIDKSCLQGYDVLKATILVQETIYKTDGYVKGLTFLNNRVYIVRFGSDNIEEYDTLYGFDCPTLIHLADLKEPRDIVACKDSKSLYVSDCKKHELHKIVVGPRRTHKWSTIEEPEGLSISDEGNNIVVCCRLNTIRIFSPDGLLVKSIQLPVEINRIRHAINLPENRFVVCYGEQAQTSNICIIRADEPHGEDTTVDGHIMHKYSETCPKLEWPTRMAVTEGGCILVISSRRQGLFAIDPELRNAVEIQPFHENWVSRMCMDADEGVIYVSENEEHGRILKYRLKTHKNVKN